MNFTSKFNDILFGIIFIYYLTARQWPYGGVLQTILDVLLGLCFILICFKYYVFCAELKKAPPALGKQPKQRRGRQKK